MEREALEAWIESLIGPGLEEPHAVAGLGKRVSPVMLGAFANGALASQVANEAARAPLDGRK